jgi:uncharacterized protein (TIGR00369 family)
MNQIQTVVTRTRTYDWQDPSVSLRELPRRSGIDLIRAMTRGDLPYPPLAATLGFERLEVVEGEDGPTVEVVLTPAEHHLNPLGSVHGGVLAAMLDTACGCAVHVTLPAGTGYTSLDLATRFLRPVLAGAGPITATGRVVSRGRRTALAEAHLTDGDGRLLAHATSTCMLFPLVASSESA